MATAKPIKQSTGKIEIEGFEVEARETLSSIEDFSDFCSKDITSAIDELTGIKVVKNRKHLQKLVYVNLVNRFDSLVDKLILWLCINSQILRDEMLNTIKDQNISKKEVFELFLIGEKSYQLVLEKIQNIARLGILRGRHSSKILKILNTLKIKDFDRPRVNNDGKIFEKRKKFKNIPNSIYGYADWLYCRRNSIVHGDGINYTDQDRKNIIKQHKVELKKSFKLQLTSIKTAETFYNDFLKIIKEGIIAQTYLSDESNEE